MRTLVFVAALAAVGCSGVDSSTPRVIVLGLDGMDHDLATRLMAEGRLPGLSRLAERGGFTPLGTSTPPLSPVAWSDFITGADAGVHGIFDFIHRDPDTMLPYLSTSRVEDGEQKLLRRGKPFWEVLEDQGVPTTILRIPANFPPSGTAGRELSGMGTPDILGGYGTFSFYTTDRLAYLGLEISGGHVYKVETEGGRIEAQLYGPDHPLATPPRKLAVDFTLSVDPDRPAVKLTVGDEERILQQGQWSDWVPVAFDMNPDFVPAWARLFLQLPAQARFFLRQVRPHVALYVSPLNVDPLAPAFPISTPESYAGELARDTGRYFTQGMPEDTGGLATGVLSPMEFLQQAAIAGGEILEQFPSVLERFDRGLLFYYVGNGDLVSHMMWRSMDPDHPAYDPERDAPFADVVPSVYAEMDTLVGYALDHMGDDTLLIAMSDHGFTSWRRTFHLNAWLHQNGYLAVKDERLPDLEGLLNVDWSGTRAYGIGLNGLYINVEGRERDGTVSSAGRDALLREIGEKLAGVVDPETGQPVLSRVYLRDETFADGGSRDIGPDAVLGYAKGTRGADPSALGVVGKETLTDNDKPWGGDHGMDPPDVPGILAASRPLAKPAANLRELRSSVLAEFGIADDGARPGSN